VKLDIGKPGFLSRTVAITVRENSTTTAGISLRPAKVVVVR
jgi:hypothetical protein